MGVSTVVSSEHSIDSHILILPENYLNLVGLGNKGCSQKNITKGKTLHA